MSAPISNISSTQSSPALSTDSTKKTATNTENEIASLNKDSRSRLNAQIIESSLRISITSGDNSQELLFRSALNSVYEAMGSTVDSAAKPELNIPTAQDTSPEAYADKILSFSLDFFDKYAAQNPRKDPTQLVNDFVDLVRGGFEKGFNEATDILKALDVFNGNVESEISKTYELVMKGFDDFIASKLPPAEPETKPAPEKT